MRRPATPSGVTTARRFALVAGLGALAAFITLSVVSGNRDVPAWEMDTVDFVTGLPPWVVAVPRLLMHLSTRFTIPLLALLAYLITLRWRPVVAVLAAFVTSATPSWLAKHLVSRPRPTRLQDIEARDDFYGSGYPSGHVTIAVATAAVLIPYLLELPQVRRGRRLGEPKHLADEPADGLEPPRWLLVTAPFTLAAGVALARIYVGAHYPLDVVGGALAGLAGAWLVLAHPYFRPETPSAVETLPVPARRLAYRLQVWAGSHPVLHRWVEPPTTAAVGGFPAPRNRTERD